MVELVPTEKLKLLCVIPTLGHGGAQKVMVELIHSLLYTSSRKVEFEISLLTFREEVDPIYKVDKCVKLFSIDAIIDDTPSLTSFLKSPLAIRRHIKTISPDIILSFQDIANFPVILAAFGLKIPVISSERMDPRFHTAAPVRKFLRLLLYNRLHRVIVQTTLIAEQMPKSIKPKLRVIPNAVPPPAQNLSGTIGTATNTIISAGRLEAQKDFSLLINAFAQLPEKTKWRLKIFGEGSLRTTLQAQIDTLNLNKLVTLEPATTNIFTELFKAKIFVLPSRYEGFPNILSEAVSAGLPSIAFDSVSGTRELITNNSNGILLSESQRTPLALAQALLSLMDSPDTRLKMKQNCEPIAATFNPEIVYQKWMDLIINSIQRT
ncbi:hypothetical protein AB833_25920 [Chromatiales bacterium (ex Bugula neritina AB1)]|nr:hypothetical protein AB833_25920 [Chromatiales bacterium (ex Bugula neritina AB1)]